MKNPVKEKRKSRVRRRKRIRADIFGTATRPRLSVFRSSKHIYAQLIDDEAGKTLVSASDYVKAGPVRGRESSQRAFASNWAGPKKKTRKATKTESAALVGAALANAALKDGVTEAVFDRGGFKYHGRVKALAEAARKEGLKF